MRAPRPVTTLAVLLLILAAAAVGFAGYTVTYGARQPARPAPTPTPTPPPTPSAVASATLPPSSPPSSATANAPSKAGLAAALRGPLSDPRLGGRTRARVVDAATGAVLYDRDGVTPTAPASTAKILTATAVLALHRGTDTITTKVMAGAHANTVVLVGGGDPTLTAAAPGTQGAYADAARISDLARQVTAAHPAPIDGIVVDDSLFTGPRTARGWMPEDAPSDYASPITATMVDGGRDTPDAVIRSAAPDLAAGRALARALGVPNAKISEGTATAGARQLGHVDSAPISELVAQMLATSDNVIAECLARQVALAAGQAASFEGAAAAIRAVLSRLGADPGTGMVDGSGLSADDRLSVATLSSVIEIAADERNPRLHTVIDSFPVAAWSGTLADRYQRAGTIRGAGVVRAKTGTLTSVSSLAGVVHDADGRLLIFALVADEVGPTMDDTVRAEHALDGVAATLAGCGCR